MRRMIGTVPVEEDGSAMFRIPANTPVTLQPLDEEGKALQQMRSWLVGMPGEYVSCAGCHESQNSTAAPTLGLGRAESRQWTPPRGTGPSADSASCAKSSRCWTKYCVGCHNGPSRIGQTSRTRRLFLRAAAFPRCHDPIWSCTHTFGATARRGITTSLTPLEFHANTSLLVQMLRKGHHNVKLDAEAWDRLITWIDINVPAYGTYHEVAAIPSNFEKRRYEWKIKYANVDEDIEAIPDLHRQARRVRQTRALAAASGASNAARLAHGTREGESSCRGRWARPK